MARILIAPTESDPRTQQQGASQRGRVALALLILLSLVPAVLNSAPASAAEGALSRGPVATVRADEAWTRGVTGEGVGIALIDTGVAGTGSLRDVFGRQLDLASHGRSADGHGHGTFLAGLMVGRDGPDGPLGIAPGAELWSVKVADAAGEASMDGILAGIALVREKAKELGIRVVVLAAGGPAGPVADPVEAALEQLWADGLVVVVASGNRQGEVTEPGVSPYLLTVGAADDRVGERLRAVEWSGSGPGRDGAPKPDLLAPGTSVLSLRAPGSVADRDNPASRIGGRYFRGSGTSMAAAIAAGSAALVLDANPHLTPDEVKGRLMAAAAPVDGSHAGLVDVVAAIDSSAPAANAHLPQLVPAGSAAQGHLMWVGKSWVGKSWVGKSWVGKSWVGKSWVGKSWVGKSWVDYEWQGMSWRG